MATHAAPGKKPAGHGIALSWRAPSNDGGAAITSYLVYRATSGGNETFLTTLGNVTSCKDTSAARGQTCWDYVKAKNSAGVGPAGWAGSAILES